MNFLAAIIVITIALFIWFIRMTKPDRKNLKIVHRKEDHNPLFV